MLYTGPSYVLLTHPCRCVLFIHAAKSQCLSGCLPGDHRITVDTCLSNCNISTPTTPIVSINQSTITIQLSEDAAIGQTDVLLSDFVQSVAGIDIQLAYTLTNDVTYRFTVNATNGALFLTAPLDFESLSSHQMTIRVWVKSVLGVTLLSTSTTPHSQLATASSSLVVMVMNVNDNPPTFQRSSYTTVIPTNTTTGTTILTVG